jgi:hypothetical protein
MAEEALEDCARGHHNTFIHTGDLEVHYVERIHADSS